MFRKFIITVICCLSIFALSAVPSYAAGFGGGQRGGGFGSGGFSGNTISTYLSYDALSDLCVEVNYNLEHNVYSSDGFPSSGKYAATIVSRSDGYYIGVYKAGSYTWFRNPSGGFYICKYDVDSLLSSIFSRVSSISSTVSTISDTLTDKLTSMESSLTRLLSRTLKTDQNGIQYTLAELVYNLWQKVDRLYDRTLKTVGSVPYTISDLQYNTWQQTERTASRLLKTVDNVQYTVADLQYNTWQQAKNAVTKLGSIDTRLSTLHTDAASLGGKLDNIADLLNTTTFTCGYKSDATGTAYPTQTIPYNMAVQIAARINSEMLGKQMTVIKRDGSGTVLVTVSRCLIDSNGYIYVRSSSDNYYLCGKNNTIFVADQDYTKSIYSRLSDVISAVNNLTVGVDLSDVQLSVDASSINLFNNTAYCCGYRTDADGNLYPTLPIPFDSAAAILERLNTDYVDKKITVFSRSGAASSGYLRSASITSDGYIRIVLTNGYTYYLCDNTNVLYLVDASSNYGSRANDALTGISSQLVSTQTSIESALSTIIDKMDNLPASVDNIVVNITKDNDAYNVFYVEDENGDRKSVTSVAGDSLSASGKLLQFLYKLIIGSAISDVDSSINGLNDFYFDNAPSGLGEGVTVWD